MRDILLKAVREVETVSVRYFGGSEPGTERQIQPIAITDEKLRALCLKSNEVKTFLLSKLELAVPGVPSERKLEAKDVPLVFSTLSEFASHYRPRFESMGFAVQVTDIDVTLHRRRKNGQPLISSDYGIHFQAETVDHVFDGEEIVEQNRRPRERPWTVRAVDEPTKTLGSIQKAQEVFLQYLSKKKTG